MDEREARALRLKRLKRKRMLTVGLLCLVLAGLVGGYFILNRHNEKKAAEEAKKEEERLAQADAEVGITTFLLTDVTEVEFSNEEEDYHFVWETEGGDASSGKWIKQDEREFPTNEEQLQTLIGTFCEMTGTKRIAAEDVVLSSYGLDDTKLSMKITLSDGAVHEFQVGDEAPYTSGYYLLYKNTGDVFVATKLAHTRLIAEKKEFVLGETFPTVNEEAMMEVRVKVRGEEEVSYLPEENADGSLTYPSIFYDCTRFVASTIQEYNCTDFSQYGLDDPYVTVTVDYLGYTFAEDGTFSLGPATAKLEIGDQTVSGNYFVRVNDSNFVYIMVDLHAKKFIPQ